MAPDWSHYYIQDKIKDVAPHHESFEQLWETKWKQPAEMGVYPFMFGTAKDFEPAVADLVRSEMREPYDWDAYAEKFFPHAEKLEDIACEAEAAGEHEKASEYFLRASSLYRISRFPAPRSAKQRYAWSMGKQATLRGLSLKKHTVIEVQVPHIHAIEGEGWYIPIYYSLPSTASLASPAPLVIIFTGLDGYRTELVTWAEGWRQIGVAVAICEIPGTGDSPALASDPKSPDRQWSSLLDWVERQAAIDNKRICIWGFSTGGYYAIRAAHTHADRLCGVVAQGGGCHHMFDKAWLDEVNHLEYPFDLGNTLAYKWGYGDDVETFKQEASDKFSLLKDGTLDSPTCARLLLVNGTEDEIFPIDDYYLALRHGAPKEARFVANRKHMGEPESFFIILAWIYKLFGIHAVPADQMSTLPFKPRF